MKDHLNEFEDKPIKNEKYIWLIMSHLMTIVIGINLLSIFKYHEDKFLNLSVNIILLICYLILYEGDSKNI